MKHARLALALALAAAVAAPAWLLVERPGSAAPAEPRASSTTVRADVLPSLRPTARETRTVGRTDSGVHDGVASPPALIVSVHDGDGTGVAGVAVRAFRSARVLFEKDPAPDSSAETDRAGRASFVGLDPGPYLVVLDLRTLPAGLGARTHDLDSLLVDGHLRDQGETALVFLDPGAGAARVEVSRGKTTRVELSCGALSTVHGYVRGARGEPIAGASVRVWDLEDSSKRDIALTDEAGYYACERLEAGRYALSVALLYDDGRGERRAPAFERYGAVAKPPCPVFDVPRGATVAVDYRFGPGPIDLEGFVVDQDGSPFADLAIWAYYTGDSARSVEGVRTNVGGWAARVATVCTDSGGRYRIRGVWPGEIAVSTVHAGHFVPCGRTDDALAIWTTPQRIDLRGRAGTVVLPVIRASERRPFRLAGEVVLDDASCEAEHGRALATSVRELDLSIELFRIDDPRPVAYQPPNPERIEVGVDPETGAFAWAWSPFCSVRATLVLRDPRRAAPEIRVPIDVTPHGEVRDLVVRYP